MIGQSNIKVRSLTFERKYSCVKERYLTIPHSSTSCKNQKNDVTGKMHPIIIYFFIQANILSLQTMLIDWKIKYIDCPESSHESNEHMP